MYDNKRQAGFTLIEVVISMLIFSIISLISYNALQVHSAHQAQALGHLQQINALQKASLFIKRDISQLLNQQIALEANVLTLDSLQNDAVLKIRYLFEDDNLIRKDLSDADNPVVLTLIKNVEKVKLRLLNNKNKWLVKYSHDAQKNAHIKAFELNFESDYWGKIKQWVMIGE